MITKDLIGIEKLTKKLFKKCILWASPGLFVSQNWSVAVLACSNAGLDYWVQIWVAFMPTKTQLLANI